MRIAFLAVLVLAVSFCKKPAEQAPAQQAPSLGSVSNPQPPLTPRKVEASPYPDYNVLIFRFNNADKNLAVMAELIRETEKSETKKVSYDELKQNSSKYFLKFYRITGRILKIREKDGADVARIAIDRAGKNVFHVSAVGTRKFVAGDSVDAIGVLSGNFTYKSSAGVNVTIPEMTTASFMKAGTITRILHPDRFDDEEDAD